MNVEHREKRPKPDSLGNKRTNKAENQATVRVQVEKALTRMEAVQEDHPDNYQQDSDIYSTAVEACAKLSLKKRLKKHQDNQVNDESTGDDIIKSGALAVLQETNIASKVEAGDKEATSEDFTPKPAEPKNTFKEENYISFSQKNRVESRDAKDQDEKSIKVPPESENANGQGDKSIKVPASNTFDEPDRKTSFGEQTYFAISSYVREEEDEVNLSEGAPVELLEESDGGWWRVRTQSFSVGWAPSNYLMKSASEIQQDEMSRLKQCSIKPARPPKTRHVKRMAKECKEENNWLYYQQKQQQQVRKKSASDAIINMVGLSQLPSRDTKTTPRSSPA